MFFLEIVFYEQAMKESNINIFQVILRDMKVILYLYNQSDKNTFSFCIFVHLPKE